MTKPKLSKKFIKLCKKVTAKRPKTLIDHILKHGFITTQELKDKYGYNHPPRAVRDVKENGIPIEMYRVEGGDGRKIAAYRFGDPTKSRFGKLIGRNTRRMAAPTNPEKIYAPGKGTSHDDKRTTGESTDPRAKPVPAPARAQPGRLVPMGQRSV